MKQLQLDVVIDLALEFATRRHLTLEIGIGAPASASSASSEPAKQESKPSSSVPCAVPVGPSMIGQHITGQPFYETQSVTWCFFQPFLERFSGRLARVPN